VPDVICDVSPLQYLHQVGLLDLLRAQYGTVMVPQAVVDELRAGTALAVDLPIIESLDWIKIVRPRGQVVLPLVVDLGPGEREVLAVALENPGSLVVLDDAMARQYAKVLGVRLTGTLGVLLKAKEVGSLPSIAPVLDKLQALRFRIDPATRDAVLRLAGEA
jgi:uncharacterized protein